MATLVNQLWSFAGDENRSDVNQMFIQPLSQRIGKAVAGSVLIQK
jgi:hypothetical protein